MTQSTDGADDLPRGWWIIAAAFLGVLLCQTPVVFLSFGVFMAPLQDTFGWDRSSMSLALSLSTLTLAVASPFAGRLLDRWGARPVLLTSLVLMALSIMSLYFLTSSLWHLRAGRRRPAFPYRSSCIRVPRAGRC